MITTITTTTTTTVTTFAGASLVAVALVTLIVLLIQKEIFSGLAGTRAAQLSRAVDIAVAPLFIVFVTAFVVKVIDVLR